MANKQKQIEILEAEIEQLEKMVGFLMSKLSRYVPAEALFAMISKEFVEKHIRWWPPGMSKDN